MRYLAIALLGAGLVAMLYAFTMDTSVSVRDRVAASGLPSGLQSFVPENLRTTDPERVDRRQTFLVGGGFFALVGAVLLAVGTRRQSSR